MTFDESSAHFAAELESKDVDNGQKDEMFGSTDYSENSLKELSNSCLKRLQDLAEDDELKAQVEDGLSNIFDSYSREIEEVDVVTDEEIARLIGSLEADLVTYEGFTKESIAIDANYSQPLELMSNVDGKINRIDLNIAAADAIPTLASLDENFPKDVVFFLTVSDFVSAKVIQEFGIQKKGKKWIMNSGRTIDFRTTDKRFTVYARDAYVKMGSGQVVAPKEYYRAEEANLVKEMATDFSEKVEFSDKLFYQGGNLRATSNILFIGADDIDRTMYQSETLVRDAIIQGTEKPEKKMTKEEAIDLFENKFGKKVVVVGVENGGEYEPQPPLDLFHIDMFITPLSDNEIIIAELPSDHESHEYVEKMCDLIKSQLPNMKINRLPLVSLDGKLMNYSNVLVENFKGPNGELMRKIYVPQYTYQSLIDENRDYINQLKSQKDVSQDRQVKNQKLIDELENDIAKLSAIGADEANNAAIDHYQAIAAQNPRINCQIVGIQVDVSALIIREGLGGSLNCLTNEYREFQ
ncbi:hypothetical protein KKC94_03365 [Patescibacteria group bacterium]|nr:hypothetical protein [Patescibacteria group bacterium]